MKLSILLLLLVLSVTTATAGAKPYALTLRLTNVEADQAIFMALYDRKEAFLKPDAARYREVFTRNPEDIYVFQSIPAGRYAVSIFQDINGNRKLDTSFFGKPREPFGFSNNAVGRLGPPSFKECEFSVAGNTLIEVTLK